MCSASTQPIVLNYNPDNDPTIDRRSYTYALKYKSDPNMKDRYYICPRAFDPIVEKPVFFDSIKDIEWKNIQKTGKKMIGTSPYGNQTLINSSPDYLKLISQLPHGLYPGFKNPNNNPDNLCMPCCFIKSKLNNIRTKKCLGIDSNDIIVDDNKKYLLGREKIPLDNGRYGLLPVEIAKLLECKNIDQGFLENNTKVFVRIGFSQENITYSFLKCFLFIFNKIYDTKLTIEQFINHLINKIKNNEILFKSLNNGYR